MEEVRFTKDNELIVNDILRTQNKIENTELKTIGEKFVICAGALAIYFIKFFEQMFFVP